MARSGEGYGPPPAAEPPRSAWGLGLVLGLLVMAFALLALLSGEWLR
jgi:hypothetical protein